ncbi:hypothetical protein CPB85DRAFT_806551 [Mucidula mucida]|nr:hypothetical protein CPB85DRAFT_806551 [Mucidula mucida]
MAKKPRNIVAPSKSAPPAHRTERMSNRWNPLIYTLNSSSKINTSNLSSRPSTVPPSRVAQQPTVPNSIRDASANKPAKRRRRGKGSIDRPERIMNDAGTDERNPGLASPPKLPKRKSKARPQKKPETQSGPVSASPAKRSLTVVDDEEDFGGPRSKKRQKIGQTAQVPEEASRASSPKKRMPTINCILKSNNRLSVYRSCSLRLAIA